MQLKKIEIDFDIHQLIEAERKGFDEPQYLALRRLLKLPAPDALSTKSYSIEQGKPFVEDGVSIPHGSEARMEYQRGKQVYEGQFLDGALVVEGQRFNALSAAASAFAVTKKGTKTSLNGWMYWQVRFPGELEWRSLQQMRDNGV